MKPSQNSLFESDTYIRAVAESGILGPVHTLEDAFSLSIMNLQLMAAQEKGNTCAEHYGLSGKAQGIQPYPPVVPGFKVQVLVYAIHNPRVEVRNKQDIIMHYTGQFFQPTLALFSSSRHRRLDQWLYPVGLTDLAAGSIAAHGAHRHLLEVQRLVRGEVLVDM
jgi:hypothetical protein